HYKRITTNTTYIFNNNAYRVFNHFPDQNNFLVFSLYIYNWRRNVVVSVVFESHRRSEGIFPLHFALQCTTKTYKPQVRGCRFCFSTFSATAVEQSGSTNWHPAPSNSRNFKALAASQT